MLAAHEAGPKGMKKGGKVVEIKIVKIKTRRIQHHTKKDVQMLGP